MATTGANIVEVTATVLEGSAVTASPSVVAFEPGAAEAAEQGGAGSVLDKVIVDLSMTVLPTAGSGRHVRPSGKVLGAYAKNGGAVYSTSGTTPVSPDLTNLATGAASSAGDTGFATVNAIVFRNLSANDMTIAPGGSNPSNIPKFTGTSPTIALPANSVVVVHSAAGVTIDGTHKVFTVTPTSGGNFSVSAGGA
jgi:hypothetical protein